MKKLGFQTLQKTPENISYQHHNISVTKSKEALTSSEYSTAEIFTQPVETTIYATFSSTEYSKTSPLQHLAQTPLLMKSQQ